jgi:hypothetical protein
MSSQPPSQPQISADGKFYWDGQRWVPMPARAVPWKLIAVASLAILLVGAGSFALLHSLAAGHQAPEHLVRADPKTLVARGDDFPQGDPVEPVTGLPVSGALFGSNRVPTDAYSSYVGGQGMLSVVAIYGSVDDAKRAFAGMKFPASGHNLSFKSAPPYVDVKVGDEQRVFAWDPTPKSVSVEFYWRTSNVIAELAMSQPTSRNYPTTSAVEASLGDFALFSYSQIAPRVQTRIRLALGA